MLLPLGDDLERPYFPVATVVLIFLNVAVFALVTRMGLTIEFMTADSQLEWTKQLKIIDSFYGTWGAVPSELVSGQVIGLITYMFLHVGLVHLIGNMLMLWVFGPSLETALGGISFALLYIFWGAVACAAHAATDLSSDIILIGASGAIAGVLGGYVIMFGYQARIKMLLFVGVMPIRFKVPAIAFGVFWILSQLYNASIDLDGTMSGVAWMCHVGGFGAGAICMLVFRQQTDRILVGDGESLRFVPRKELETEAANVVDGPESTAGEASSKPKVESRPCPGCATMLGEENLIAERLLRCPNDACSRLTYLTEVELQAVAH